MQRRTDPTDIVVRVDGGSRSAVRLVHLPPGVQTEDHKALIDWISSRDPVVRAVSVMSLALDRDMWSAAAFEARRLHRTRRGFAVVDGYALVGVCQLDFEAEKGRLRKFFPEATYNRVCSAASAVPAEAAGPPAPCDAAGVASLPKSRLGTALLIGNWKILERAPEFRQE